MEWSNCPLVASDPEIVHGEPVVIGTRIPVGTIVENVEAYMDEGLPLEQAIHSTLESFPGVPEGAEGIRKLLLYRSLQELQSAA